MNLIEKMAKLASCRDRIRRARDRARKQDAPEIADAFEAVYELFGLVWMTMDEMMPFLSPPEDEEDAP